MKRSICIFGVALSLVYATTASAQKVTIDLATGKQTPGFVGKQPNCPARVSKPATKFRHPNRMWWVVSLAGVTVEGIGKQSRGTKFATRVAAWSNKTGKRLWRKRLNSTYATDLDKRRIIVTTARGVDVIDVRTGKVVGKYDKFPLRSAAIYNVCRNVAGFHYIKTDSHLLQVHARSGRVTWGAAASTRGPPVLASRPGGTYLVDVWYDAKMDYGIVLRNLTNGKVHRRVRVGSSKGPWDFERFHLASTPGKVSLEAWFAVE